MDRRGDVDHDRTKDEHKGEGTVWASLKGVCVEAVRERPAKEGEMARL